MICWKRRSRAPSFSMYLRYSSRVVAPMHWISPRARAGLRTLEASMAPSAPPAPTRVCNSSMNRMVFLARRTSFMTALMRSSNCPRYLVPATIIARSRTTMRRSRSSSGTLESTTIWARPSTMAVLPTPASPKRTGLFLVRRDRTWVTRSISFCRPMTGSSLPWRASSVRSRPEPAQAGLLGPRGLGQLAHGDHVGAGLDDFFDLQPDAAEVNVKVFEDVGGDARAFLDQAQEDVLGADVFVVEALRLLIGELHHLAGSVG